MTIRQVLLRVVLAGCGSAFWGALTFAEEASASRAASQPISGREIFLREWLPNDPRSHGGDGLGPVFNESSCVACHNQGGVGGAGSESKNVTVISAVRLLNPEVQREAAEQAAQPAPPAAVSANQTLSEQFVAAISQAFEDAKKLNAASASKPAKLTAE